jgi:hypothetical protein
MSANIFFGKIKCNIFLFPPDSMSKAAFTTTVSAAIVIVRENTC